MAGLTLALILYGFLCCLSLRQELKGHVVFYIEAECSFRLDPSLEAGVKGEIVFTLLYCSAYL